MTVKSEVSHPEYSPDVRSHYCVDFDTSSSECTNEFGMDQCKTVSYCKSPESVYDDWL